MRHRLAFTIIVVFTYCILLYLLYNHAFCERKNLSVKSDVTRHNAVILTRRLSIKVLKHLNALVNAGVNAYVMCDEPPWKYTDLTNRILYIDNEALAQYGLTRNLVWDRVFVWLYKQSSFDYIWIMEDDVTWSNIRHIVNLFDKYTNDTTDLLSRRIFYKNKSPYKKNWVWWPKHQLSLLPENKWSCALNVISRISKRLINAHHHYVRELFREKKRNSSLKIDKNYYYQEFLIPTAAHMFDLKMATYDRSNTFLSAHNLNESEILELLTKGVKIFHAVKHNSQLLINATL